MKKFTDDETIKALEVDALSEFEKAVLDLLKRQRVEIERLQKHNATVAHKHFNDGIKYLAAEIYKKIGSEKNKHYKAILERVDRFGADRYEDLFCSVCDGKILALDELQFFIEDFVKEMERKE